MDFPCRLFILERRKGEIKRWVITHHQSENFLPEKFKYGFSARLFYWEPPPGESKPPP